jgi:hypothetical protein
VSSDTSDPSKEGMMDFFVGILDGAIGVAKNISAVIAKGGERSELRYWCDQNTVSVTRIDAESISKYMKLEVDIPTGMTGKYIDVVDSIKDVYSAIDFKKITDHLKKYSDAILVSMSRGSKDHETILANAIKELAPTLAAVTKASGALNAKFKPDATSEKVELGKVTNSFAELKEARTTSLSLEEKLLAINKFGEALAEADKSVDLAIDFIKKTQANGGDLAPSKIFIKDYATYVRNIAIIADSYAACCTKHLAVEHNLVLTYTTVGDYKVQ